MTTGKIGRAPHFRIYLFEEPKPGKQEGILRFCKPSGDRYVVDTSPNSVEHFDSLDDIPERIRTILRRKGARWPPDAPV
jgi:hypothetical protein